MYLLILIIPFLGFFLSGTCGRFIGRKGSAYFCTINIGITALIACLCFYEIAICKSIVSVKLYTWVLLDIYNIEIGLYYDTLTVIMVFLICIISFFVHLYAMAYMYSDPYISRFMCYLSLFTFFMLILVTCDNFFQLFVGWEGVGLCSYLLINFWFTRIAANKAAINAMCVNRIADVFFILGIFLLILNFKTCDFLVVFNLLPFIASQKIYVFGFLFNQINLITFFLFIGALGKSAQIGFHTWLPQAMEGPTPVSALLHAATMVTAGVFLVIRSSLFFEYSSNILGLLCFWGSLTALFSGMVALFQYDIKKIIAYSTCSQLGYMFLACGLSNYNVAFFHLFNHAFFKALLFLSAGFLIHTLWDEQDIRKMGGLVIGMPFLYIAIIVGSLAILGFPFLSGFFSKDLILELTYSRHLLESIYLYLLVFFGALFTAMYSLKIIFYVFFSKLNFNYNFFKYWVLSFLETINTMFISIFFLILLSIVCGYLFFDNFVGYGSLFFNNSIYIFLDNYIFLDIEYLNPFIKNLPILMSLILMFLLLFFFNDYILLFIYRNNNIYLNICIYFYYNLAPFFYYAFFFNKMYNKLYSSILYLSYFIITKILDKGFLEKIGPLGFYKLFKNLNNLFDQSIPSYIFFYIYIFFLSLIFFFYSIVF